MYISVKTNIIPLIHHLVDALQPFARAKNIQLSIQSSIKTHIQLHQPEIIGNNLFSLLCRVISYLPEKASINIATQNCNGYLIISVEVPGINLSMKDITKDSSLNIGVQGEWNKKTVYTITLNNNETISSDQKNLPAHTSRPGVPSYYAEIRKRLQAHTADKQLALTKLYNPADATFLQKINDVILLNISNESFDANLLCRQMFLSRAQVFRKLKNIAGMAPAAYIKHFRLQKAKKILETTDKRVGEVAFETGFESVSHFTKVFTKRYGFNPSLLKRKQDATN